MNSTLITGPILGFSWFETPHNVGSIRVRKTLTSNLPRYMEGPFLDEFLNRLATDEDEAWNEAYLPLYQALWKSVELFPGFGIDRDDLIQEVILEIRKNLMAGESGTLASVRNFEELTRMARRIAKCRKIDLIRSVKRKKEESLPEGWDEILGADEGGGSDLLDNLVGLLNQLDPPKPEILKDHFIGGFTQAEIAARRNLRPGTVASHIFRGLKLLKAMVLEQIADEEAANDE